MKLTELKINPENPRIIKDRRFRKLMKSIKEFPKMMELRPIVIDDDNIILGGNMRYKAIVELGYKEIPDKWVRKASELTEDERKRFIIEDNIQHGDWDISQLTEWDIEQLSDWGLEIDFEEKQKQKEIELTPYKKTHILLSFEPGKLIEIQKELEKIQSIDGIEFLQSSN